MKPILFRHRRAHNAALTRRGIGVSTSSSGRMRGCSHRVLDRQGRRWRRCLFGSVVSRRQEIGSRNGKVGMAKQVIIAAGNSRRIAVVASAVVGNPTAHTSTGQGGRGSSGRYILCCRYDLSLMVEVVDAGCIKAGYRRGGNKGRRPRIMQGRYCRLIAVSMLWKVIRGHTGRWTHWAIVNGIIFLLIVVVVGRMVMSIGLVAQRRHIQGGR